LKDLLEDLQRHRM